MSERTDGGLKGGRENFVQFFGEKDVVLGIFGGSESIVPRASSESGMRCIRFDLPDMRLGAGLKGVGGRSLKGTGGSSGDA